MAFFTNNFKLTTLYTLVPLALVASQGLVSSAWGQAPQPQAAPTLSPASWNQCLQRLQPTAQSAGVTAATWLTHLEGIQPDATVLTKLDNQPEFKTPIWDYLAALVDDERVADGQRHMALHAATLQAVAARYGVDAATVVAVWGVESNFGQSFGRYPLVQALGTLSCFGRRQAFFQKELYATLRILQGGHVAPEAMVGSWAGAFGHTQFMPTTYERLAVDFDGDGRRDLTSSIPDALASTAHFLQKAGWRTGLVWGAEVKLPTGVSTQGEGRRTKRPASTWSGRGLRLANGQAIDSVFPPDTPLGLMTPAGANGPAFLVSRNFDALYSYNAAESYGLAIAHLSDRLRDQGLPGGRMFTTDWPTDDPGLSRVQRRELQTLLLMRGHDIGEVDGMLGEKSRQAIRAEQARLGHEVTARAGQKLLNALQRP
ncbi:MAG: lytic murein transglycosylase [Burkholderiaceae bacterium]|nr:lytic murein transglycosylase [Burkholderiaceae bacterium]MDZ4163120.1 lytic murein transglycosylase [Burkholderiales bacterium]